MITEILTGVLDDGNRRSAKTPDNPRRYLRLSKGESSTVRVRVITQSGVPVALSGSTLVLTVKANATDIPALISRVGTLVPAEGVDRVDFELVPGDTSNLSAGRYNWDVWVTRSGRRDPLIPVSPLLLEPAVSLDGAPVSAPAVIPQTLFVNMSTDVTLYMDPAGSDANDGLSVAKPLLTLDGVFDKLPPLWGKKARVIVAAGTYTITGAKTYRIPSGVGRASEPLIFVGGFTNEAGDRTSTAASATVLTDSTLALTTNIHRGARIRLLTGAGAGQARLVRTNTATALTVNAEFSPVPTAGDQFRIERPSVIFNHDSAVSFASAGRARLGFQGTKFSYTGGSANAFSFDDGIDVTAEGCEWNLNTNGSFTVNNGSRFRGRSDSVWASDVFSALRLQAGVYIQNGSSTLGVSVFGTYSELLDYLVLSSAGAFMSSGARMRANSLYAINSRIAADFASEFRHDGSASFPGLIDVGSGVGILFIRGSRGPLVQQLQINNVVGDAVVLEEAAYARLNAITGTGNSGFGVLLRSSSTAIVNTATTVTGTSGDLKVGPTTRTWGQIALLPNDGTGGFVDIDSLCRVGRF